MGSIMISRFFEKESPGASPLTAQSTALNAPQASGVELSPLMIALPAAKYMIASSSNITPSVRANPNEPQKEDKVDRLVSALRLRKVAITMSW